MHGETLLQPFSQTLTKSEQWMKGVQRELDAGNADSARRAMRATLHDMRDEFVPDEAAALAGRRPMLVRDHCFEWCRPAHASRRAGCQEQFLQRIADKLQSRCVPPPQEAANAVFAVTTRHVTPGEVEDVRSMLPREPQKLWPGGKFIERWS